MSRSPLLLFSLFVLAACEREESPPRPLAQRVPAMEAERPPAPFAKRRRNAGTPGAGASGEAVDESANKETAATAVESIVAAVSQFEIDYDRLPLPLSCVEGVDCFTVTDAADNFPAILMGGGNEQNPRRTDYLGGLPEASRNGGKIAGGRHYDPGTMAAIYDPWGYCYRVVLDVSADGKVANPEQTSPTQPGEIEARFIVWSGGPDGNSETWEDNICSWKQE